MKNALLLLITGTLALPLLGMGKGNQIIPISTNTNNNPIITDQNPQAPHALTMQSASKTQATSYCCYNLGGTCAAYAFACAACANILYTCMSDTCHNPRGDCSETKDNIKEVANLCCGSTRHTCLCCMDFD